MLKILRDGRPGGLNERLQVLKRSGKPWGPTGSLWLSPRGLVVPAAPPGSPSHLALSSLCSDSALPLLQPACPGYSQADGSRSDSASPLSGTLQRLLVLLRIKSELCNVVQGPAHSGLSHSTDLLGTSLAPQC